jgi:hypothetical protein
MTEAKPKRRWFRFSLRTLFVLVTVFGIGAGVFLFQKEARLVHQRRQFVAKLETEAKNLKGLSDAIAEPSPLKNPDRTLSPIRKYLGDHNYSRIVLPLSYSQTDVDQAVVLFPEAEIQHWQPHGAFGGNGFIHPVVVQEMK